MTNTKKRSSRNRSRKSGGASGMGPARVPAPTSPAGIMMRIADSLDEIKLVAQEHMLMLREDRLRPPPCCVYRDYPSEDD